MRRTLVLSLAILPLLTLADAPKVIRFGSPSTGAGGRPVAGGSYYAYAANQALLEDEFRKDGIKVDWSYFVQAGPAANEAFANGLLDVSTLGDQPLIVGKAGGLKNKLILAAGVRSTYAVLVPSDSKANSVAELRGKRVAIFKGTANQLAADRILEVFGLTERDLRVVNMNGVAAPAALAAKDIDAYIVGSSSAIQYQDQGIGRIIYRSDTDPKAQVFALSGIQVTEDFEKKYPEIVQRIVNVLVRAAAQVTDPANRNDVFKNWAKSGFAYGSWKRDNEGRDFKGITNPTLDAYYRSELKKAVFDLKRFKLLKNDLDVDAWIEPKYLDKALKDLKLEAYWR